LTPLYYFAIYYREGEQIPPDRKHGFFRRNGSIAVDAEHGHLRRRSFFGRGRSKSAIAWQADAHGSKDATLDRETFFKNRTTT
jgi:hypothetical protein